MSNRPKHYKDQLPRIAKFLLSIYFQVTLDADRNYKKELKLTDGRVARWLKRSTGLGFTEGNVKYQRHPSYEAGTGRQPPRSQRGIVAVPPPTAPTQMTDAELIAGLESVLLPPPQPEGEEVIILFHGDNEHEPEILTPALADKIAGIMVPRDPSAMLPRKVQFT